MSRSYNYIKDGKERRFLVDHLYSIKARCRRPGYMRRGLDCSLTLEDMEHMWERDNAQLLEKPSVDRINGENGYHLRNCRFIELHDNLNRPRAKRLSV